MWSIANKKKFDAGGNSDAGGDNSVYETIVCKKARLRIDVCLNIIDKGGIKEKERSQDCPLWYTLFFIRTSKFWPRFVVLKFLHNLSLNCF